MFCKAILTGLLTLLSLAATVVAQPTASFTLARPQVVQPLQTSVPRNAPRIVSFENVEKRTLTIKVQNYAADFTDLIVERRDGKNWREVGVVKHVDHRKKVNPNTVDHRARPRSVYAVPDKGLQPGVTYSYRARATQPRVGWLIGAESVVTTKPPELPRAPDSLRFTNIADDQVSLTWRDNAKNETIFVVFRRLGGINDAFKPVLYLTANVTSCTLTGLKPATLYEFFVKARNADGLSAASSNIARGNTRDSASDPAQTPTPTPSEVTRTIFLQAQSIQQGHQPYAAVWPPAGVLNGRLKKISIPNVPSKTLFVRFIKQGRSTIECGDPSALVTLTDGQSSTPSQIEAIFGSEHPKFPLVFIACVGTSKGLVGDRVAINITYTLNE